MWYVVYELKGPRYNGAQHDIAILNPMQ